MNISDSSWARKIYTKTSALNYGREIILKWLANIMVHNKIQPYNILDFGLGSGDDLINIRNHFSSISFNMMGIDVSECNLDQARSNSITAFNLDIEKARVPLSDQSVDLIIANHYCPVKD